MSARKEMKIDFTSEAVANAYVSRLSEVLNTPEGISKAVKGSGYAHPTDNRTKTATLKEIDSQFDENGDKKLDAVFTYHDKSRQDREVKKFLRDGMSDREQLAFVASYFEAGSDVDARYKSITATDKTGVNGKLFNAWIEASQVVVARELKEVAGFKSPVGYEVKDEMQNRLTEIKETPAIILLQIALSKQLFEIEAKKRKAKPEEKEKLEKDQKILRGFEEKLLPGPGKLALRERTESVLKELSDWRAKSKKGFTLFKPTGPLYDLWKEVKPLAQRAALKTPSPK